MADEVRIIINAVDKASGTLSKISSGLAGLGKGVLVMGAVGAAGIALLAKATADFIGEAMAAEEVSAQLNAVIESTGGIAGVTTEEVYKYADAMSLVTKYDDEAIVSAQSLMLTFTNVGEDVFPTATTAALDMSTALNTDLKSSVIMIGKALNDPTVGMTALTRAGVTFTEEQKKQIKTLQESGDLYGAQAIILQELEKEFGGAAEAAGSTFAGQLAIANTQLGNIKETIGAAFLPTLTELAKMFNTTLAPAIAALVVTWLPALTNGIKRAMGVLSNLFKGGASAGALAPLIGAFKHLFRVVQETLPRIQQIFADVWNSISGVLATVGPQIIANFAGIINGLAVFWRENGEAIMQAIGIALKVLAVVFIGAFSIITAVVSEAVNIVNGILQALKLVLAGDLPGALTVLKNMFSTNLKIISSTLENFFGAVLGLVGTNLETFKAVWKNNLDMLVTIAKTIFNRVVETIRGFIGDFAAQGRAMIDGIISGVIGGAQALYNTVSNIAGGALAAIKEKLGIESPSRAFAAVGRNIMLGLEKGILEHAVRPMVAVRATAANTLQAATPAGMGAGARFYNPVINIYTNEPDRFFDRLQAQALTS